eukprot:1327744-Prymnesium_polylepis.1
MAELLPRTQDDRREVRVVHRVREALCLQADTRILAVACAALAHDRTVEKVGRVQLQPGQSQRRRKPRRRRPRARTSSTGRRVSATGACSTACSGRAPDRRPRTVQRKAMVVAGGPARPVDLLDPAAERPRQQKVERRAGNGPQLARRDAVRVNGQHVRTVVQRELVAQNAACAVARE